MPRIGRFDRRDALLQQLVRDAAIALERELDVVRGHRIAVVERGALAQHELVGCARPPSGDQDSARLGASALPGIGFTIASCSA